MYTFEPFSLPDLDSIISIICATKFIQVYSSGGVEESSALVKYGDDYLYVSIHKVSPSDQQIPFPPVELITDNKSVGVIISWTPEFQPMEQHF